MIKKIYGILAIMILFQYSGKTQILENYPYAFQEKMEKMGVELFLPIESRIKQKKLVKDDFLEYDLVLKSKRNFEIRYFLYPENQVEGTPPPQVELTRTLASIATNDEEENIRMTSLSHREAKRRFGADWAIYADFVPKQSFSDFAIGRIVSLFKEGRGYLNCIILYKKDNLDAFMGLPIHFKENEGIDN